MRGYRGLFDFISFGANLASIVSCVVAIVGVTKIVYIKNETKEILKEIKVEKELNVKFIHDTIIVEKPIYIKTTIKVPSASREKDVDVVSKEAKDKIEKDEKDFRKKHQIDPF